MALGDLLAAGLFRTARGIAGQLIRETAGAVGRDLTQQVLGRLLENPLNQRPADLPDMRTIARLGSQSARAAARLAYDAARPDRRAIPVNPSLLPDSRGDIAYSVVVEVLDQDTHTSRDVFLVIRSPDPLTGADVRGRARTVAETVMFRSSTNPRQESIRNGFVTDVRVVGVERAPR